MSLNILGKFPVPSRFTHLFTDCLSVVVNANHQHLMLNRRRLTAPKAIGDFEQFCFLRQLIGKIVDQNLNETLIVVAISCVRSGKHVFKLELVCNSKFFELVKILGFDVFVCGRVGAHIFEFF